MSRTIEKVILGVLIIAIFSISAVFITGLDDGSKKTQKTTDAISSPQISLEQAKSIALGAVDTNKVGAVTDIELENENGKVVYAVEFTKNGIETDVKIDAGNGKVLLIEDDNTEADQDLNDENELEDDESEDVPITGSALEKASAAALKYVGEGRVTDTEIDDEEGYYEIEITRNNGQQVDVHLDENFNVLGKDDEEEDDEDEE